MFYDNPKYGHLNIVRIIGLIRRVYASLNIKTVIEKHINNYALYKKNKANNYAKYKYF